MMERQNHERLIRLPEVLRDYIPVSRMRFLQGVKSGEFPAPVKLGTKINVWRESELIETIDRIAKG